MFGIRVNQHGGPEILVWQQLPDPVPTREEVVVQVLAVGINHLDLWVRKGVPGHRFPLPLIPGSDIVGNVVDWNGHPSLATGNRVMVAPGVSCGRCPSCLKGEHQLCREFGILGESRDGGYAELVAVPRSNLLPAPTHLTDAEAASMPLAFLTAWHMLVGRARIEAGMTVLVQAGMSGVGSAAIQIARLHGARVITTAGSAEKVQQAVALGADHGVNYRDEDFVDAVCAIAGKEGVDIVVDHIGEPTFKGNLRLLRPGGTLVMCGSTAGSEVPLNLRALFFKAVSILGSTMGSLGEMATVAKLIEQGKLAPVLDRSLPIQSASEAHELLEARRVQGKIALTMPEN